MWPEKSRCHQIIDPDHQEQIPSLKTVKTVIGLIFRHQWTRSYAVDKPQITLPKIKQSKT